MPSLAEVPRLINYQGRISESDGSTGNSDLTFTFNLYSSATDGESLWQEVHTAIPTDRVFNVLLGSLQPLPDLVQLQDSLFLSLSTETDGELLPRQQIVSVAYALRANVADNVAATTIKPAAVQLSDGAGIWNSSGVLETAVGKVDSLVVGNTPVINSDGRWIGLGATHLDSIVIIDLDIGPVGTVVFFGPEFLSVGFDQFLDVEGPVDLEFQLSLQLVTNFPFEVRLGYKQVIPINVDPGSDRLDLCGNAINGKNRHNGADLWTAEECRIR